MEVRAKRRTMSPTWILTLCLRKLLALARQRSIKLNKKNEDLCSAPVCVSVASSTAYMV